MFSLIRPLRQLEIISLFKYTGTVIMVHLIVIKNTVIIYFRQLTFSRIYYSSENNTIVSKSISSVRQIRFSESKLTIDIQLVFLQGDTYFIFLNYYILPI